MKMASLMPSLGLCLSISTPGTTRTVALVGLSVCCVQSPRVTLLFCPHSGDQGRWQGTQQQRPLWTEDAPRQ